MFTFRHATGWDILVLDSALRHVTDAYMRQILASPELYAAIDAASVNGSILAWNGGAAGGDIQTPAWHILIRHESQGLGGHAPAPLAPGMLAFGTAQLVVFHADLGDNYRQENRERTQRRLDEPDSYRDRMRARMLPSQ
jgi:hypothetical protein